MERRRGTRAVSIGIAALGLVGAAPASADRVVVDREGRAPKVTAHAGRAAWNHFDPDSQRYQLMTYADGVVSRVPVRSRREPFDVDLGPDSRGRTVAVYSRCSRERGALSRGCDLYRFDWQSGREVRIRSVSTVSASEYLPSIWKGRLAFVRVHEQRPGRAGSLPYVYVADLKRGRTQRLPSGTRGVYELIETGEDRVEYVGGPGPTSLDLRGRRLAVGWAAEVERRCNGRPVRRGFTVSLEEIWLMQLRSSAESRAGRTLVARECNSGAVYSPFLGNGALYYVDASGAYLTRFSLAGGTRLFADFGRTIQSAAYDGTAFLYSGPSSPSFAGVFVAEGVTFEPERPPTAG